MMHREERKFFAELTEVAAATRDVADYGDIEPARLLKLADELNMTGLLHVALADNKLAFSDNAQLVCAVIERYNEIYRNYDAMLKKNKGYFAKLRKADIPFMLTGETAVHKMMGRYGCFRKTHMEILVSPEQEGAAKNLLNGEPVIVESGFRHIKADVAKARSFRDDNCVQAGLLALDMCASMPEGPQFTALRDLFFVMIYADFDYGLLYQLARCYGVEEDCRRAFLWISQEFPTSKLLNGFLDFLA